MLDKGRVNAVVGAVNSCIFSTNHLNLKHQLYFSGLIPGYKEQWFQRSKRSDQLQYGDKIKKAFDSMTADGFVDAIYHKYLGPTYRKAKIRLHD